MDIMIFFSLIILSLILFGVIGSDFFSYLALKVISISTRPVGNFCASLMGSEACSDEFYTKIWLPFISCPKIFLWAQVYIESAKYCKKQEKGTFSHVYSLNVQTDAFCPLFTEPFCFAWMIFSKKINYRDINYQASAYFIKQHVKPQDKKWTEHITVVECQSKNWTKKVFVAGLTFSLFFDYWQIDKTSQLKSMYFGYESLAYLTWISCKRQCVQLVHSSR